MAALRAAIKTWCDINPHLGDGQTEADYWEEFMEAVKVVGCDRIVIGTDCGHFAFPAPVEAMRLFITGMLMRGIPDKDVEKMVKTNPRDLLY